METIRFIDLLANVGRLREKFEKAFHFVGTDVECVLTSEVVSGSVLAFPELKRQAWVSLEDLTVENTPAFDFLLASFSDEAFRQIVDRTNVIQRLFTVIKKLLQAQQPYGFIIENIDEVIKLKCTEEKSTISEEIQRITVTMRALGYEISWKVLDSDEKGYEKNIYVVGTLRSAKVLKNLREQEGLELGKKSEVFKWLVKGQEVRADFLMSVDEVEQVTEVQKELLSILLAENRKKDINNELEKDLFIESKYINKQNTQTEKQVYFKLYPPKKLGEITKEDGSVTGLVHSFIFQEVFEETEKELDSTRHLMSDLQALFTSSGEQILVLDASGKILRVSGTFFQSFWKTARAKDIIGQSIYHYSDHHIFQPNVFDLCKKKEEKVTAIQESGNHRIWSVATPVYENGVLEKVVVLSKKIAEEDGEDTLDSPGVLPVNANDDKRLIFRSKTIEKLVMQLARVAKMNSTVLLEGETGVGKEIFAHKIHELSSRSDQPMIRINCGAIPEQLMESELFGYEKGSFTGADKNGKIGYFELAHHGTIFLDEIAELSLNMQVKLLRVLQEREVTRIGGTHPISVDARIIAATNQNLHELVSKGAFREDLYYRLNVIPFNIPPLRNRKEDIFPLAVFFLEQQKRQYNMKKSFTPEAIEVLETYDWPGNVRELQNIIERLLIFSDDEWIEREHVLLALYGNENAAKKAIQVLRLIPLKDAIAEVESQLIDLGMKKFDTAAELSKVLKISPASLSRRMNRR